MQEEVDMLEMQELQLSHELQLARKATSVQAFRTEVLRFFCWLLEALRVSLS